MLKKIEYNVKFTDSQKSEINLKNKDLYKSLDVTLFGSLKINYGNDILENLLHLLEKFSCPENESITDKVVPDFEQAFVKDRSTRSKHAEKFLEAPVEGQIWFNSTRKKPYFFNGTEWQEMNFEVTEIGVNWGQIINGLEIPTPTSNSGYEFEMNECSFLVSPLDYPQEIDFMNCRVDQNGLVTMQYILDGDSEFTNGIANYLIIGIKDNSNNGSTIPAPSPP